MKNSGRLRQLETTLVALKREAAISERPMFEFVVHEGSGPAPALKSNALLSVVLYLGDAARVPSRPSLIHLEKTP